MRAREHDDPFGFRLVHKVLDSQEKFRGVLNLIDGTGRSFSMKKSAESVRIRESVSISSRETYL